MGEIKRNASGSLNNTENIRILGIWKWFSRSSVVSKRKKNEYQCSHQNIRKILSKSSKNKPKPIENYKCVKIKSSRMKEEEKIKEEIKEMEPEKNF